MPSERVQRQIDTLLDQAEQALSGRDWQAAVEVAEVALGLDPDNDDAKSYLDAARRGVGAAAPTSSTPSVTVKSGDDVSSLPPSESVEAPTSFASGRYTVSKFLGEGGKKRVYLAHDTLLDREVAFALIKTEGFDQTSKERISREAQAMGRLGVHPNIVAVLDLGQEDDGTPYMVTELMRGGDIEGVLEDAEENRLSLDRTIEIGKAVCEGLEFAHARGIVHRDLKPGNVWLTEDGTAKIGDFGLAVMTDRSRLTREGMMVGTVSYMPPEQATGGDITPKADLYSLGAMLYEMVTGRPPFLGDDEIAIIGQHINTPPVAPTWHNGDCPRPLEALVMRLLAKDPSERPDSAQDVFNALDAIDLTARGETVEREANSLESLAGGVFVGRQAEMDQLKAALEDVLGGRGRLLTLVGEPGIGKTRTCEELATYAGLRGAQVLWGRCYEGGGAPPYWPWVQAIRSYVRDIDPDELRRQMGSSASVIAEIVTDVKDRLPELQPPPQIDDPDSARFRLFDSITSFLRTASQSQPLVIVLDDLHWSDQPSLSFLEFIARELNQSRVMLLCTYRDMELNRRHQLTVTLGDLARDRLYERVLLRGLTETDIARFVEIAAGFAAPRELSATVHRHTEGNPLFVTEVIRDLVQSGELTEEKVSGRSTWSVRIPEGVREVIGRRLDRLSDRANEVFTTAAVIGREFRLAALRELADDTTEGQLLDVLDEALDSKLIEELPDEIGHYQFTHALVQETLTGELSSARKVRLHAHIAETLERLYGEMADEHAAELVPHFIEAEPVLGTTRLVHLSRIAGRSALAVQGYEEAESHLRRAVDLTKAEPLNHDGASTLVDLADAEATLGRRLMAADHLKTAFDYYVENGLSDEAISAVGRPYGVVVLTHLSDQIKAALDLAPQDSVRSGNLLVPHGWNVWQETGEIDDSVRVLDRAISIAEKNDDHQLKLAALAMLSNVNCFAGRWSAGYESGTEGVEIASAVSDANSELRARIWSSVGLIMLGDRDRGRNGIVAAVDRATELHSPGWLTVALSMLRILEIFEGNWSAVTQIDDYHGRVSGVDELSAWRRLLGKASVALQTGQMDLGIASSQELVKMALSEPDESADLRVIDSALQVVDMARRCGVQGAFEQELPKLLSLQNHGTLPIWHNRFGPGFTPGSLAAWIFCSEDREGAEQLICDLETAEGPFTVGAENIDHLRGRLAVLAGKQEQAKASFESGLKACRNAQYRFELAWTCSDYAEMILDRDEPGDREKAIELQDEALAITQELGMRPLTERILARREILRA